MHLTEKQEEQVRKAAYREAARILTSRVDLVAVPEGADGEMKEHFLACIKELAGNIGRQERDPSRYDPIVDEKKEFTLQEFTEVAKSELEQYRKTFEGENEFHKEKHTWLTWFRSFHEYMSW